MTKLPTLSKSRESWCSRRTQKKAAAIVNSIIRQACEFLERANISAYSFPHDATESLIHFATEFVNSLIDEAKVKAEFSKSDLDQKTDIYNKMYPNIKYAKESQQPVFEDATLLVHKVLSEAERRTNQIKMMGVERFAGYRSVSCFKVKDGLEVVARCISRWSFNPHWYFKIIYNGRLGSDSHSYFYTVRWSVPSLAYPVAQVTADIYFHIEVCPMTPPPVFIKVCYRLETDRSSRCALKTPFLEKWLHTVIKRKLEAFQMFTF